ncbi:DUF3667 domain-containing protein [Sphingobacterium paludis]|uniref:Uncharacterized protein DUF3667 n=1 Tax=Sphingobacterium paludis TaxID=1476465 RepID=A0A4R7CYB1_9SPHI|nr:DUF3667 domain-containing protein [Sphingobacterium paludis]TDS12927.1 uncharacterized protein DUF3667 [Sphingobacterium paludis]
MNCTCCSGEVDSNYCPSCGRALKLKRINGHYIVHEIEHILHFEKGILYTIQQLLLRPGKSIHQFLTNDRTRLVKPVIFIIISSLIYSLINGFFHIEDQYMKYDGVADTSLVSIFKWIQSHYGYANIIMGVFIAWCLKLFFRKYPYNFFEILILLCFVMSIGMLIFALFALIQGLLHYNLLGTAGVVGIIYYTWAIGQFFDEGKPGSYGKALAAYVLGAVLFMFAAIMLGMTIDNFIGH